MVILLLWLAWVQGLGWISAVGLAITATLLIYEHYLVKPNDLSRLNAAFFNTNGWIGILLLLFWGTDILLHG
jgi:4-hydroxybenzoate polyprenyltransferase